MHGHLAACVWQVLRRLCTLHASQVAAEATAHAWSQGQIDPFLLVGEGTFGCALAAIWACDNDTRLGVVVKVLKEVPVSLATLTGCLLECMPACLPACMHSALCNG